MMGPQGMVTYDPNMGGMPMGGMPAGRCRSISTARCRVVRRVAAAGLSRAVPNLPAADDDAADACPQPVVACPPPPQPLRWAIWGEALWIHPTGVDMAHAQQQDGLGGAGTVPFGNIARA